MATPIQSDKPKMIRIDPDVYERIRLMAFEDHVSIPKMANTLLRECIAMADAGLLADGEEVPR